MVRVRKRGVVAVQFNWIFVLIAGALILMFFIMFIGAWQKTEKMKVAIGTLHHLDSIFFGYAVQDGSSGTVESSRAIRLEFSCTIDDFGDASSPHVQITSHYGLVDPRVTAPLNRMAVFSPSTVSGREINIHSRSFNLPFRVDKALFISSPSTHFVLIGMTDNQQLQLRGIFPEHARVFPFASKAEFLATGGLGGEHTFLITNKDYDSNLDASGLSTIARNTQLRKKVIDFDKKEIQNWRYDGGAFTGDSIYSTALYFDDTTLLAALYSDGTTYWCNMEKLYDRFKTVGAIHQKRYNDLETGAVLPVCRIEYGDASEVIGDMLAVPYFLNYRAQVNVSTLEDNMKSIQDSRRRVEEFSCPRMY